MPNKATVIVHDVEVGAEKLLSFVTGAQNKVKSVGPGAVSGLATILGAVAAAIEASSAAASQDGLNVALDVAAMNGIKQVWPELVTLAGEFGIKI